LSYQVLARKWRPKNFEEVVGQKHVLQALINALNNNRIHHAYLFSGTRGVGKTTLGRIFAKSLNCDNGVSATPCGQCNSCREIDEGRFVDLLEVDAASRTKVDETRELLENVQYAPTRGRYKVYLIDEVHMLTTHSFNALLKTLEEPPPHVKFILATTDPQKLPVTILSRCLKFNLKAIPQDLIVDHMQFVLQQENIENESTALRLIARSATGSMRDALSLLDQAIAHGNGVVQDVTVREMLGTIDNREVTGIIQALIDNDAPALLDKVQQLASSGSVFSSVLAELVSVLHLLALAQITPNVLEEDDAHLLDLAQKISPEDVQLYYQIALLGQKDLPLAPDPRAGFEMVLLRMYAFRPDGSAEPVTNASKPANKSAARPAQNMTKPAVKARVATRPSVPPAAPANTVKPVEQPVPNAAPVTANKNEMTWQSIVNQLPLVGIAKQVIANSVLVAKEDNVVRLLIESNNANLASNVVIERIQQALSGFYGQEIKIKVESGQSDTQTPAAIEAQQKQDALSNAVKAMESDPNIIAMKETFNATLDPRSVKLVDKNT